MNQPGNAEGNWRWRCTEEMLSAQAFQALRELTHASARLTHNVPELLSPEVRR